MKKFILASLVLVTFFTGCASNEVASNSSDDMTMAGGLTSADSSIDTSGLSSDMPPTTNAEVAPTQAPVAKTSVSSIPRRHRRQHHRKHLAHKKHRKHHRHAAN